MEKEIKDAIRELRPEDLPVDDTMKTKEKESEVTFASV